MEMMYGCTVPMLYTYTVCKGSQMYVAALVVVMDYSILKSWLFAICSYDNWELYEIIEDLTIK